MIAEGRIYLSHKRVISNEEYGLCATTTYFAGNSSDVECVLMDVQLRADQSWMLNTNPDNAYYIVALVGGLELRCGEIDDPLFLLNSHLLTCQTESAEVLTFINPFADHDIRFLVVEMDCGGQGRMDITSYPIPVNEGKNSMQFIDLGSIRVGLGLYDGRAEDEYRADGVTSIITYTVNGAFEFVDRLLETGDGLSLSQSDSIQWEALSSDALIFMIEKHG